MILVDSHCHLDLLGDQKNIAEIVVLDNEAGVRYIQTICTKLDSLPNLLNIAETFDNVYASVGVHPCEVTDIIVSNRELINLLQHDKIIGLGETGLDYYHDTSKIQQQKDSFVAHIVAGQISGIPLIVHTRDADHDTIDIITSEMRNAPFTGLIHCFTASRELAYKMLDLGIYISISGIVTFKNASSLQDVVKSLPMDRLLIETDAPYLSPVPMRKQQNEPAFVGFVAEIIAKLKNLSKEEVAKQTTDNFFKLFSKANRA
jgi:TatD DNase family protein